MTNRPLTQDSLPDGWKPSAIMIRVGDPSYLPWRDGEEPPDTQDETWLGFVHDDVSGIALTPARGEFGRWRLTHIASGYALGSSYHYDSIVEAAMVAQAVGPLNDWTVSFAAVVEQAKDAAFRDRVKAARLAAQEAFASRSPSSVVDETLNSGISA